MQVQGEVDEQQGEGSNELQIYQLLGEHERWEGDEGGKGFDQVV